MSQDRDVHKTIQVALENSGCVKPKDLKRATDAVFESLLTPCREFTHDDGKQIRTGEWWR